MLFRGITSFTGYINVHAICYTKIYLTAPSAFWSSTIALPSGTFTLHASPKCPSCFSVFLNWTVSVNPVSKLWNSTITFFKTCIISGNTCSVWSNSSSSIKQWHPYNNINSQEVYVLYCLCNWIMGKAKDLASCCLRNICCLRRILSPDMGNTIPLVNVRPGSHLQHNDITERSHKPQNTLCWMFYDSSVNITS